MGIFVSDLHCSSVLRSLDNGHISLLSVVIERERRGTPFPHYFCRGLVLVPTVQLCLKYYPRLCSLTDSVSVMVFNYFCNILCSLSDKSCNNFKYYKIQ